MRDDGPPAIEAVDVAKSFGQITALRGVDMRVDRGSCLMIFGPNGAGKSTLLGILATLIKPSEGWVRVEGLDVREEAEKVRSRIGIISHQTMTYDDLTASENLLFYGKMFGVRDVKGRVDSALEQVGLAERRNDRTGGFSRGMKQRLSIARSMMHDPSVLLLDEPFTGLDPSARKMMSQILQKLKGEGRTVVMTTHEIGHGLPLANRAALLVRGLWAFQGPTEGLDAEQLNSIYEQHAGGGA